MARRYLIRWVSWNGKTERPRRYPTAAAFRNRSQMLLLGGLRLPHHLVNRDRQMADAPSGGVEDGVGYGGPRTDDADLAQPLDADRARLVVLLVHEDHVDVVDVGV